MEPFHHCSRLHWMTLLCKLLFAQHVFKASGWNERSFGMISQTSSAISYIYSWKMAVPFTAFLTQGRMQALQGLRKLKQKTVFIFGQWAQWFRVGVGLYFTAELMHSHAVLPGQVLTVAWHRPPDAQPQRGHILPQPLSALAHKVYE